MEKRPTVVQVLRTLASGEIMSPQRIGTKTNIANQTVRNLLVFLTKNLFVERVGYAKYKITDYGLEHNKFLSKPSKDQTSRRET